MISLSLVWFWRQPYSLRLVLFHRFTLVCARVVAIVSDFGARSKHAIALFSFVLSFRWGEEEQREVSDDAKRQRVKAESAKAPSPRAKLLSIFLSYRLCALFRLSSAGEEIGVPTDGENNSRRCNSHGRGKAPPSSCKPRRTFSILPSSSSRCRLFLLLLLRCCCCCSCCCCLCRDHFM